MIDVRENELCTNPEQTRELLEKQRRATEFRKIGKMKGKENSRDYFHEFKTRDTCCEKSLETISW